LNAAESFRDKCILRLLFDSARRLGELVGIKDTDFNWKDRTVIVSGKTGQRKAPFGWDTSKMLQKWFGGHKTSELNKYGVQSMLRRLEEKTGSSATLMHLDVGLLTLNLRKVYQPELLCSLAVGKI